MHITINLLSLMAQKNITPKQVSEKTGLSIYTINAIMNGQKTQLKFQTIASLCEHLECDIGDLLVLEKEVS
ncbi:helix-turn-helix transcriptional regulator [Metabacillus fastidiosus]|uniref:Helix-turn-helix transcriptional regulator n=1 Tax=Metabacillus fastidiosus TaxID=1458 RepID=A0ABU6NUB3_9BACI|nr:helix-turn-helix transcriptional regulator [Metabacillus fastidiosus]